MRSCHRRKERARKKLSECHIDISAKIPTKKDIRYCLIMLFVQGYKDWFFLPPLINQRPRRTKLQVRISKQTIYLKLPSSSSSSVVTLTSSPCCSFSAESYRKQERALPVAACLCIWTAPVASFVKHTTG